MTGPQLGRDAIVSAAIELFAERGIDGVSLGDIHRASGHRNRSATAYHFGGKHELVVALITQIMQAHDEGRVEQFDLLESAAEPPSLRAVLAATIVPMVADLGDRAGRQRIRTMANVTSDDRYMGVTQELMRSLPGLGRSTRHILTHLDEVPEHLREERMVLATSFGLRAFADQARLMDTVAPARVPLDTPTFAAQMPLLLEALLLAPVS